MDMEQESDEIMIVMMMWIKYILTDINTTCSHIGQLTADRD